MKSLYKKYLNRVQDGRPASGKSHSMLGDARMRRQAKKATNNKLDKDFQQSLSDGLDTWELIEEYEYENYLLSIR